MSEPLAADSVSAAAPAVPVPVGVMTVAVGLATGAPLAATRSARTPAAAFDGPVRTRTRSGSESLDAAPVTLRPNVVAAVVPLTAGSRFTTLADVTLGPKPSVCPDAMALTAVTPPPTITAMDAEAAHMRRV